jgi:hypothetical protein
MSLAKAQTTHADPDLPPTMYRSGRNMLIVRRATFHPRHPPPAAHLDAAYRLPSPRTFWASSPKSSKLNITHLETNGRRVARHVANKGEFLHFWGNGNAFDIL